MIQAQPIRERLTSRDVCGDISSCRNGPICRHAAGRRSSLAIDPALAAAAAPAATPPQQDKSFSLGTPVALPEELSGIWEAPDGHGGAVGIHLILDTTVPVDATTLVGVPQSWLGLQVGLYQRTGAEFETIKDNGFSDSPRGGSARYQDGRLTLHAPGHDLGYDLDLRRIPGDKWSGRFHREDFDAVVTLARPALESASNQPWFLGTWKSAEGRGDTACLHIAQQSPTAFIAWVDTLNTLGSTVFPPQFVKPPYAWEHYGDLVKVEPADNGALSVVLGAYNAICCPRRFHATSSDRGQAMKADWLPGSNHVPRKSEWTKMPGGSCIGPP